MAKAKTDEKKIKIKLKQGKKVNYKDYTYKGKKYIAGKEYEVPVKDAKYLLDTDFFEVVLEEDIVEKIDESEIDENKEKKDVKTG